jgi:hypothetical protein
MGRKQQDRRQAAKQDLNHVVREVQLGMHHEIEAAERLL